mgnify:CR=1 FL=1
MKQIRKWTAVLLCLAMILGTTASPANACIANWFKRPQKEIGISAVRGGTIVGDHDVIFAGEDKVITFSHRAYSRAVFGKGAVVAAKFLAGKPAGFYTMHDVLA